MTDESPSNRSLSARISKLERQADGHERNTADLARALTGQQNAFEEAMRQMAGRVKTLEENQQARLIAEAAANVEDKQLRADVREIKTFINGMKDGNIIGKVNDMSAGFNRLFWLVIGAIVTGAVGLVFLALRGGLGA